MLGFVNFPVRGFSNLNIVCLVCDELFHVFVGSNLAQLHFSENVFLDFFGQTQRR